MLFRLFILNFLKQELKPSNPQDFKPCNRNDIEDHHTVDPTSIENVGSVEVAGDIASTTCDISSVSIG